MNVVNTVAERIAELKYEIDECQSKLGMYNDSTIIKYLNEKIKRLEKLKEENEQIYMVLRNYQ